MDAQNSMTSPEKFICDFPDCNASYQRKEHLSRHQAQHIQLQSFQCSLCNRAFGRNDTLRRHMRRIHAVDETAPRPGHACSNCRNMKIRCEGGPPCHKCLYRSISCSLNESQDIGRRDSPDKPALSSQDTSSSPPETQKDRFFVRLYFERFHPYWPFVHIGSFNQYYETPLLVQSMMVIGMWANGGQSSQSAAIDLHNTLGLAIYQQRGAWDVSTAEEACSSCAWPIPTYQAILLHIIFALIHKGRDSLGFDLKPSLPPSDMDLLECLVVSCKRLGMLSYPNILARYTPEELASYVWISIEEIKRFNLTLYKVYNMVSRPAARRLTTNDLKFPIPKNDPLWNAVSKEEWLSASPRDLNNFSSDDVLENEWISNSAKLLDLIGF